MARKKSAYTRERNRIMSNIRRLRRKGYNSELYFPTEKELRSTGVKGKELAKATRELKSWTARELREYVTNETLTYTQEETNTPGFTPPTNVSDDITFFDDVAIQQWYNTLDKFAKGEGYNLLRAWIGGLIRENGKHNVAIMLQQGAESGNILSWEIAYRTDQSVTYIGNMMDYLPDQGIIYKEETLDKIDYIKMLGDALEQEEDWEKPE